MNIPRQFQELQDICKLKEGTTHDLPHYVKGLRPDIMENMNHCNNNNEAYLEAFRVERMLRRSHMRQCQPRAHVVERLF